MLRFVFAFLILFHGLIHILGFIKEFQLARVSQLTGKILIPFSANAGKAAGILWFFTCFLFILSAIFYLLKKDTWWIYGGVAVLLSQILIIQYWQDAKFGTIANIIILLFVLIAFGNWNFNSMIKEELKTLQKETNQERKIITPEMIAGLPPIVQKWLHRSQLIGKEMIHRVHLQQKGVMKTKENGKWMNVQAEQYFQVDKPGFIWIADVEAAPYIHLYGRDKYENGHGHMLIKLLSLFPVANVKGKETDQGTLLRFLAETVWFPSAAFINYITWKKIDALTAKATMNYGGISASGIFKFNSAGDVLSFEALRYYDRKEGPTLEKWFISINDQSYKDFEGIRVPSKSMVTWKLETGDFTWYKLEIADIKYNQK